MHLIPTPTQRIAWDEFRYSGSLSKSQLHVLRYFWMNPGRTRNELDHDLGEGKPNANFSRRIRELIRANVIWPGAPRRCSITGKLCTTYWPTMQAPVKVARTEPSKAKADRLERALKRIRSLTRMDANEDPTSRLLSIVDVVNAELGPVS